MSKLGATVKQSKGQQEITIPIDVSGYPTELFSLDDSRTSLLVEYSNTSEKDRVHETAQDYICRMYDPNFVKVATNLEYRSEEVSSLSKRADIALETVVETINCTLDVLHDSESVNLREYNLKSELPRRKLVAFVEMSIKDLDSRDVRFYLDYVARLSRSCGVHLVLFVDGDLGYSFTSYFKSHIKIENGVRSIVSNRKDEPSEG